MSVHILRATGRAARRGGAVGHVGALFAVRRRWLAGLVPLLHKAHSISLNINVRGRIAPGPNRRLRPTYSIRHPANRSAVATRVPRPEGRRASLWLTILSSAAEPPSTAEYAIRRASCVKFEAPFTRSNPAAGQFAGFPFDRVHR